MTDHLFTQVAPDFDDQFLGDATGVVSADTTLELPERVDPDVDLAPTYQYALEGDFRDAGCDDIRIEVDVASGTGVLGLLFNFDYADGSDFTVWRTYDHDVSAYPTVTAGTYAYALSDGTLEYYDGTLATVEQIIDAVPTATDYHHLYGSVGLYAGGPLSISGLRVIASGDDIEDPELIVFEVHPNLGAAVKGQDRQFVRPRSS